MSLCTRMVTAWWIPALFLTSFLGFVRSEMESNTDSDSSDSDSGEIISIVIVNNKCEIKAYISESWLQSSRYCSIRHISTS